MEKILTKIAASDGSDAATLLNQLKRQIMPGLFRKNSASSARLRELTAMLKQNESWRNGLRKMLRSLLSEKDTLSLFTESGILPNDGFFSEIFRKVSHVVLPPAPAPGELRDVFNRVFDKKNDHVWISHIPDDALSEFIHVLQPDEAGTNAIVSNLLNAVEVLTHRATGIGLDPVIITRYPDLEKSGSPFFVQHHAVMQLLDMLRGNRQALIERAQLDAVIETIDESVKVIKTIRNDQHTKGASLALTYLSQRMYEHEQRIKVLLEIIYESQHLESASAVIHFFKALVKFENRKNSLGEHIKKNIGFLAYQVTEHAGRTGEHYITSDRKEYKGMLRSAMGGGFIVGFLSCFKTGIYYLHLAPLWEAFLYSMNYSLGFITIHLTHSTLATKQPAMTAAKIAASLDVNGNESQAISNLADLIVKISRSQFIAFVGNMCIAFPVAFCASFIFSWLAGAHIAGEEKAWKMIGELHPWRSLSLVHAGIAGVCLFVAGLISGYYDNEVVYRKIPERLLHHPLLKAMLPRFLLTRFSRYIENNLGSLAGNFFLGIFLGSIGTIGFLFGLPVDIRHITFASGNFGLAFAALGLHVPLKTVLITIAGIIGIGFMNFIVSFGLALWLAIQSRGVSFGKTPLLFSYIFHRLFTQPRSFLFPPAEEKSV